LWPGAFVAVWYDEAQGLENKSPVFLSKQAFLDKNEGAGPNKDALYGLTAALPQLLDELSWGQALCGPFLELSDRIALDKYSNISNRMTKLHHASQISVSDMMGCLCHYFDLAESDFTGGLRDKLHMLSGRPGWFYDKFWRTFFTKLGTCGWEKRALVNMDKQQLLEMIGSALDRGSSAEHADTLVKNAWGDRRETHGGLVSPSRLHKELYYAIKMRGGCVKIRDDGKSTLIRLGILALQPCHDGAVDMFAHEPLMARAIEKHGDALVCNQRTDLDPILDVLRAAQAGTDVMQTDSVKGDLLESLTAWHIVRQTLIEGLESPPTLQTVLRPLVPASFIFPEALADLRVHVRYAQQRSKAGDLRNAVIDSSNDHVLLMDIDVRAGADLAFCVRDSEGYRGLVLVQVKARATTSFADCLCSTTPAWQYTTASQRILLSNPTKPWKAVDSRGLQKPRELFAKLADSHAETLEYVIRIPMSLNPYQERTIELCNAMNGLADLYNSPVVPCCSSAAVFREELHNSLLSQTGKSQVSHPDSPFFWLPFSMEEVDLGLASAEGLALFRARQAELLQAVSATFGRD
jgi:hypothetical protein